jgi:spermidine synthase
MTEPVAMEAHTAMEHRPPGENVSFFVRCVPCLLAFIASSCVMIVELVAGRLMARHVGQSIYTWTSAIGVVLGGITLGNLVGGRLADLFNTRKILSALFIVAALACFATPYLNDLVGASDWMDDKIKSWPWRVATHVTLVFLPSALALGLIGPAVAKMALDLGLKPGRTVGNVYAWGALGSIVGTFMTGFYLVSWIGTVSTLIGVGLVLAAVGILLAPIFSFPLLVSFVFWAVVIGLLGDWEWRWGVPFARQKWGPDWVYGTETQYSFIKVVEDDKVRELVLDSLIHAYLPQDIKDLHYEYEDIYAAVTHRAWKGKESAPRTLFLGGGGYIFPRYIQAIWPDSHVEVAEIDPGVTRAVIKGFRLRKEEAQVVGDPGFFDEEARSVFAEIDEDEEEESADGADEEEKADEGEETAGNGAVAGGPRRPMDIYHLDARNRVEDIARARRSGAPFEPFDFIYGDAFNDYSVPFHLVTREFNERLKEILRPGSGVYMINVIDIYKSGLFVGAVYGTMKQVFDHVYVIATNDGGPDLREDGRDTFILVGTFREIDLTDLASEVGKEEIDASVLEEEHLQWLRDRSKDILTDDYSPVENLLKGVVRLSKED